MTALVTAHGRPARRRRRMRWPTAVKYALLVVFALGGVLLPLWLLLVNSAKPQGAASNLGFGLPSRWALKANYGTVLHQGHVLHGLLNTMLASVPSVLGMVLVGSFASWIFARGRSRTLRVLYYLSIVGILVPPAIVATVLVLRWVHLFGSFAGLILFYMGVFMSFAIFIMTGFIKTIPIELEEAARIDGASAYRIFRKVILPLLRPVLTTTSIVLLLFIWNDFFFPFYILTSTDQYTLTLGLYSFVGGNTYEIRWNLVFADVVLTSLPLILVYFVGQRRIVSGIMGGAVK